MSFFLFIDFRFPLTGTKFYPPKAIPKDPQVGSSFSVYMVYIFVYNLFGVRWDSSLCGTPVS